MSVVIVSVAAQVLAAAVLFLTLRDSRERRQNG